MRVISALAEGGARVVEASLSALYSWELRRVPAELERTLAQLKKLSLAIKGVEGGWDCLPPQLEQVDLAGCGLRQVPAELERLAQLTALSLRSNTIERGWRSLPRQLRRLNLQDGGLRRVPELAGLMQLTALQLTLNRIEGGWDCLPPQLEQLDLAGCGLQQVVPELERLEQLTELSLANSPNIRGGWQRLPPQLQSLAPLGLRPVHGASRAGRPHGEAGVLITAACRPCKPPALASIPHFTSTQQVAARPPLSRPCTLDALPLVFSALPVACRVCVRVTSL